MNLFKQTAADVDGRQAGLNFLFCRDNMKLLTFVFVFLLLTNKTQGSGVKSKFVKLGTDLNLDVNNTFNFTEEEVFYWRVNGTTNILRVFENKTIYFLPYKNRVEFSKNFTLILRNVHNLDAGLYTALLSGSSQKTLAEYQVHVQAAVSPIELEVVSVRADSDSCNFTVTCRTDKAELNTTFGCRYNNCTRTRGEVNDANFKAFVSNSSVMCEQSNHVSKSQQAKALQQVCHQHGESGKSSMVTWIGISVGFAVLVAVLIGLALRKSVTSCANTKRRKRQATRQQEVPGDLTPAQNVEAHNIHNEMSLSPIYSLVEHHTEPIMTTYARVQKPAKPREMQKADSVLVPGHNNPLVAL
ncbi:uncharacterized protein LOC133165152 [Syngnathus typhle]|uniref:uncharacterized protein LOC133165152 n=1 Tax=Syngnathus typhle TaxID=161592 RepID=UPI002A6AE06E|nr:uncharacterized protein LOC133165152 [Syngnathus typhle]